MEEIIVATDFHRSVYGVLGLPFDALDMGQAVNRVRSAIKSRTPLFLSTPNINFLISSLADDRFRDSVLNSDLSLADGMPLVWVARLFGIAIPERVSGSDLFEVLRLNTDHSISVFIFGGSDGVAELACRKINANQSTMKCAGYVAPGFGSVEEMSGEDVVSEINRSGADFLVVALGAKKGQAWIEHNRANISVPVICHLGAVVNFVAGTVLRAPVWMRRTGLEWCWRIKEEPVLWQRYLNDGLALVGIFFASILPCMIYQHLCKLNAQHAGFTQVLVSEDIQNITLKLSGNLTVDNLSAVRDVFSRVTRESKSIAIDFEGVSYFDSAFLGILMLLYGHQDKHGLGYSVLSVRRSMKRLFKLHCSAYLLNKKE